mgnify:CR=1 FL=1
MKWRSFIDKEDVIDLVGIFLHGHPIEKTYTPAVKKRHLKAIGFLRRVSTFQKIKSMQVAAVALAQAELLL